MIMSVPLKLGRLAMPGGATGEKGLESAPFRPIVVLAMDNGLVLGGRFLDGIRTNENLGRNAQSVVQLSNHLDGQGSTPIQHLGHTSAAPEIALQSRLVGPRLSMW